MKGPRRGPLLFCPDDLQLVPLKKWMILESDISLPARTEFRISLSCDGTPPPVVAVFTTYRVNLCRPAAEFIECIYLRIQSSTQIAPRGCRRRRRRERLGPVQMCPGKAIPHTQSDYSVGHPG